MQKYWQVIKLGVQESLSYRTRLLVWCLMSIMWVSILPVVWFAIYGERESIAGFTRSMILTYFFFIPLIDRITFHHVATEIQRNVQSGSITNFLTRPIHYLIYNFCTEMAYKGIMIVFIIAMMILAGPFLKDLLILPKLSWNLLWLFPALTLGTLIGYMISALIGMVSFWTTRSEWALHFWWMISNFVAGFIAPIAFYPEFIQTLIRFSPFSILLPLPMGILLQTTPTQEILLGLMIGALWVIILSMLSVAVYKRGIKKMEGIGI